MKQFAALQWVACGHTQNSPPPPPKLCVLDQHYLTQRAELQRTGHTLGLAA
jgi:hypothetical protein